MIYTEPKQTNTVPFSLIHISKINFVISVCECVTNITRLDPHYQYNIIDKGPTDGMAPSGKL
jgi:hypothetical protein